MIPTCHPIFRWVTSLHRLVLGAIALILTAQLWSLGSLPAYATGVYDLPTVSAGDSNWVIDEADILSRVTENQISDALSKLANDTGKEVRFVTVHRFDYGETADSLTEKLFQTWFPAPEAQANQVLLLLDNVTNNAAVRAGDSAKSLLSDDIAESIAQETLMVPLRDGNKYNQAFADASDRLIAVLSGEPDPGPPVVDNVIQTEGTFAKAEETDSKNATIAVVVLLILATVIPMATYYLYQAFQS